MKRPMITNLTNQAVINESQPGSGQAPTNIQRRTVIGGALVALLAFPGRVMAKELAVPADAFDVLLKGLYQPVPLGTGPNLGLSTVDVSDGTYSTTKIYPVSGIAGSDDALTAVGDFYVQFVGNLCAYDLPGGALSMQFLPESNTTTFSDGLVPAGSILQGTWELTVLEATGIFRGFVRGHNHMLDNLHFLTPGDGSGGIDEYCVCFVSRRPKA